MTAPKSYPTAELELLEIQDILSPCYCISSTRKLPKMKVEAPSGGLLGICLLVSAAKCHVEGLAYAPNFITKIIQEETGIAPATEREKELFDNVDGGMSIVGPVKTRFPPEPNGYLHLGHAKAVSFNFEVARMFDGTCNMRMDDTNPSKEDEEYVESILEDVKWIQSGLYNDDSPWEGSVRKTSGYFGTIYECAETLIKQGDAYVDSLSAEEMREYRGTLTEAGKDSPYRSRSVEENLDLFRKVRKNHLSQNTLSFYLTPISIIDESRQMCGGRACSSSKDRYVISKHQYAGSYPVSNQARVASRNRRRVVHLSNV